jgi:DNA invertase Pin-like site-specific DNA recombinase
MAFERERSKERVKTGSGNSRAQGKRRGRKPLPPVVVKKVIDAYKAAPDSSARDIAQCVGMSPTSVHRIRKGYLSGIYDRDGFTYEKPLLSI